MAQTLYLKNGKTEILFTDPSKLKDREIEFARILREHLGDDVEKEFLAEIDRIKDYFDVITSSV